jgi:hypothetical protein
MHRTSYEEKHIFSPCRTEVTMRWKRTNSGDHTTWQRGESEVWKYRCPVWSVWYGWGGSGSDSGRSWKGLKGCRGLLALFHTPAHTPLSAGSMQCAKQVWSAGCLTSISQGWHEILPRARWKNCRGVCVCTMDSGYLDSKGHIFRSENIKIHCLFSCQSDPSYLLSFLRRKHLYARTFLFETCN